MGAFDDLPISDAHRRALEAGREKFPDLVKSGPVACTEQFVTMEKAYEKAAELAFSGTEAQWVAAMHDATLAHDAWASCFYHPDPVRVVFPD